MICRPASAVNVIFSRSISTIRFIPDMSMIVPSDDAHGVSE
jgi:hypothetical protein